MWYTQYVCVDSHKTLTLVSEVDLSSWEQKIQRDAVAEQLDDERPDEGAESVLMEHHSDSAMEMSSPSQELYKDGVLTLGCIGIQIEPNSVEVSYNHSKTKSCNEKRKVSDYFPLTLMGEKKKSISLIGPVECSSLFIIYSLLI